MAKTIWDLAVEYGREHKGTVDIEVFVDGAKAVLKEIESLLSVSQIRSYHEIYDELVEKIKELKGE